MPTEIAWCDADNTRTTSAVVLAYPSPLNSKILVVGTNGEQSEFFCDPAIHLVAEMDGVRVVTNSYHELIQRVPKCVSNIFGINIQEPSSLLFEAHRKFQEKSHQSDEYLCMIMGQLELAVNECIEAASYEFDAETQKSLFRVSRLNSFVWDNFKRKK
jgi:vacuolar protein sorting-associated protein 16